MSVAKRTVSLLISRKFASSKLRSCVSLSQRRLNSNDSSTSPTRYTLTNAAISPLKPANPNSADSTEILTSALEGPKCYTCGIQLQKDKPDQPGYYKPPNFSRPEKKSKKDIEFDNAYAKLDEEGKKLFEENIGTSHVQLNKERRLNLKRTGRDFTGVKMDDLKCVRCYNALFHSRYEIKENRTSNYDEVMDRIPESANILHVVSAQDFPLGLVNHNRRKRPKVIINKADLLFEHHRSPEVAIDYFSSILKRLGKFDGEINVVSSNNLWGIRSLLERMPAISFMVGYVNSGKTLLSKTLNKRALAEDESHQKKYRKAVLQKETGTSHFPAFTRNFIETDLVDKKTYDTPGFFPERTLFDIVKPEFLKNIMKGVRFRAEKSSKARYTSVHGGQCYTIGGLFYLLPPAGTLLQIVPVANGESKTYRSLERALEIARDPPASVTGMAVKPEALENLVRYVIPPFHGKIDLVIKDFGFIQIKPIGKKGGSELFEVWVPEGLVVAVRKGIVDYVTKCQAYDSYYRPVRRGEKAKPAHAMPKRIDPESKLFTQLYRVPNDCEDPIKEMKALHTQYVSQQGDIKRKNERGTFADETKYWIEELY